MLSILIPVYNYEINKLLNQLVGQCLESKIEYEIICFDDASSNFYRDTNAGVCADLNLKYLTTNINKGRSTARNILAQHAKYENLLFMDCDVSIIHETYLTNYIKYIAGSNYSVVYGACSYSVERPADTSLVLHWLYGSRKENPPSAIRAKYPYKTFHTVNFLVKKNIILSIPFDETISGYGYEDSLWAFELQQQNISIIHIDNPVQHLGLYPTKLFLRKTAKAMRNLYDLQNKKKFETLLTQSLKILDTFGLQVFAYKIYRKLERSIVRNLFSSNPSLFYYALFKSGLMMRIARYKDRISNHLRTGA
jgi:glycosyltransferase involved in cell wall biosynthesis